MQPPPSLDVVEDTVRHEFDAHERRVDAADTRAGLVLGIAGLLVSLGPAGGWLPLALATRLLAATAGLLALAALRDDRAQSYLAIDPERLTHKYLGHDPVHTRLRLLETRVTIYRGTQQRLRVKLARLRLASGLVMAAVALGAIGATVEVVA